MDLFPVSIFPQGSLSSSVITTVWIGVLVTAFFNLRLGWVLSGLVVPGYVVPLMLVNPWSAAVVFLEGFVTFFVVRFLSERPAKLPFWCSFFGRDRFFALLLFSVVVRLLFDGWLLPLTAESLSNRFNLHLDYRNNLHSFGLIIIALIANQFWKTGFIRGLFPQATIVVTTYIIVRYGLMELTNFNVSSLGFMYEDLAASILASPKAYIILLTTAFLASRMNLFYGWDYNGILIPSLLALQWYQPTKILTTFLEAIVILLLARLILKTPMFTQMNVEGARKLLLFFNVGFAVKVTLGYLLPHLSPELKVTDAYGFGYLLATLMAIRMYDQNLIARLTRAALQTSLVAVVVASTVGFALATVAPPRVWVSTTAIRSAAKAIHLPHVSLASQLSNDKLLLYQSRRGELVPTLLPTEITPFTTAIDRVSVYVRAQDPELLQQAAELLDQVSYDLYLLEQRYIYLREREPTQGRGLYVIDTNAKNKLILEVPAPLDEQGTPEAGAKLFNILQARGLAIAGTRRDRNPDGSTDVLRNRQTVFHIFHKVMGRGDVLQVRGVTNTAGQALFKIRTQADRLTNEPPTTLWVSGGLPPGLDLVRLRALLQELAIQWTGSPHHNVQRQVTSSGFGELILKRSDIRRILSQETVATRDVPEEVRDVQIDGYLQQWLFGAKERIAGRGTDLYRPPHLEELLYLDEEVITPIMEIKDREFEDTQWSQAGLEELRTIDTAASVLGYGITRYRDRRRNRSYLILAERDDTQQRRYWGTYVFRLGEHSAHVIQVPRPGYESTSFEYGASLFERLGALVLGIAGARPDTNQDGSADILRVTNIQSLFTLVSQVVLREMAETPMMVIQSRALAARPEERVQQSDVLVAVSDGSYSPTQFNALGAELLDLLQADGFNPRLVDGSPETAGYEVGQIAQTRYLNASRNKTLGILWVSPLARYGYRQQTENRLQELQFNALEIPTRAVDLYQFLTNEARFGAAGEPQRELRDMVDRYVATHDIVTLQRLLTQWPEYRMLRLIDVDSRQGFLLVFDRQDHLVLASNLAPFQPDKVIQANIPPDSEDVDRFIASRAGKLIFEAIP